MLLAIDIGNTNTKIAIFRGKKIFRIWRLVTKKACTIKQEQKLLKRFLFQNKSSQSRIDEIIICSVVPKLTSVFEQALFLLFKKRPLILGKNIFVPIKNLYKKPKQVGQDRLVNAVAAVSKYGGPVIVVDFGTAVTFDVISKTGSYLGGVIVPGMEVSLRALIECADLLPKIKLGKPSTVLGRDTVSSMKSGIIFGYSFLVEGILQQLRKKLKKRFKVVATGGAAGLMFRYCKSIQKIDENLTLEGLMLAYERMKIGKKQQKADDFS